MSDEIRIYHVDDPNDAPERRLASLPTLNPFIPTSLPQYVIPPVANSLYNAMQYYWYTAYQQGFAAQQQQHQHQQQIRLQQRQHQQQQQPVEQTLNPAANHRHVVEDPSTINHLNTNNRQRQASPQRILCHASSSTSSSSSSSMSPQQLSSPQNHHHHSVSSTTIGNNHLHNHQLHQQIASSTSPDNQLFPTSQLASTNHLHNQRQHHHNHHHHLHHLQPHDQLHSPALSDTQPLSHDSSAPSSQQQHNNHQHIKKPLNPFMIYMQKQRPEIVKQGIIKESAAINQLLGQQWRKLSREEQEPYYKLAEQEKRLHAEKYPGWSARDNYANQKRRKKMRLRAISMNGATNCVDLSDKKCRARFGLSNMASWCKPCKRKKRCIYSLPKSSRHRSSTEQ